MGYGEVGHHLYYGRSLCAGALEESPPGRHVVEEPIDEDRGALGVRGGGGGDLACPIGHDVGASTFASGGGEGEGRDARYGGQRLPAEAHGQNGLYVAGRAYLA